MKFGNGASPRLIKSHIQMECDNSPAIWCWNISVKIYHLIINSDSEPLLSKWKIFTQKAQMQAINSKVFSERCLYVLTSCQVLLAQVFILILEILIKKKF